MELNEAINFDAEGNAVSMTMEGEEYVAEVIYRMCSENCLGLHTDLIKDFMYRYVNGGESHITDDLDLDVVICNIYNAFLRDHMEDLINAIAGGRGSNGMFLAEKYMKEID